MPSSNPYSSTFSAALHYASQGIAVVPMRPALADNGSGKPSPLPWIRWQAEGPLRGRDEVEEFWSQHPDAQLALLLEHGFAAIDIDLKHLPGGQAPEGFPLPRAIPGAYVESTKSGGLHYLLRFRERLDPGKAERVTGLGGYVDVFHGGLLIVAPSRFSLPPAVSSDPPSPLGVGSGSGDATRNAGAYAVLQDGGLPVFRALREGLHASAPWLAAAWEEKWSHSLGSPGTASPSPRRTNGAPAGDAVAGPPADPADVEEALRALQAAPDMLRVYQEGVRHPNGAVDRSMTEFMVAGWLRERGFGVATVWGVVCACAHAKSPKDPRGFARFERQVWGRLAGHTHKPE
jgi:hypothetical protein